LFLLFIGVAIALAIPAYKNDGAIAGVCWLMAIVVVILACVVR
jgi:hypothetical protein